MKRTALVAAGLAALLWSGTAQAQSLTAAQEQQVEEMLRANPSWTRAEAVQWGSRYYWTQPDAGADPAIRVPDDGIRRLFRPGVVYRTPYAEYQARVLGLATTSTGVEVVTMEWVAPDTSKGRVFAYLNVLYVVPSGYARPDIWLVEVPQPAKE